MVGSSSLGLGSWARGPRAAGASLPAGGPEIFARAAQRSGIASFLLGRRSEGMPMTWVNDAFCRLTGYTADEVLGRSPRFLADLLADPGEADQFRAAVLEGHEVTRTVRSDRHDGTPLWTQVSLSPVDEAEGEITHWIGVMIDVTEHIDRSAAQLASLELERRERVSLAIITETSDLLNDLDYPLALREICDVLEGALVGWAGFYMNDDGLRYAEGIDTTTPPSGRGQRHGRYIADGAGAVEGAMGLTDALGDATGPAGLVPGTVIDLQDTVQDLLDGRIDGPVRLDLTADYPQWSASSWLSRDVRQRTSASAEAPESVLLHPIAGRRRVLGLLATSGLPASVTTAPDASGAQAVLKALARRAGLAIDNVRLYAREHRLAETLQRAMLPEQADVTGLDVWTYYAPNSEHAQVGGDWYDVLQISPDVVGLVIGDVVGHDVEAAAAMGQLRSVVRSYAYELTTPGPVLERVDQLVVGMRIPRSASLVYAALTHRSAVPSATRASELDPETFEEDATVLDAGATGSDDSDGPGDDAKSWAIEYSRAGHLPPLLLRRGEVTQLNEAGGSLVGFGTGTRATGRVELEPGDVLLFYTDGLIERRDRALRVGLDALVEATRSITAIDSAGIGEELLSRLADAPEDDVALVVVRIPDPVSDPVTSALSPRSRRWLLPSEPASIGRARHAVLRTCQAWDLGDSANAELVVSELVANGVLHGWGHLALRLFDTGDGLRVEVEDSNPAPPVSTDGHAHRMGGFGMQIVERLADWGWRPAGSGKLVWARLRPLGERPDRTSSASD
ncbi:MULTISPECIES: SpoIIE family protein phosphatase [Oerskovia]|uniref:SpoIIE family protein phosphatase n=1 Tax=Oerskovia merdavium TaxID=2762227 RepID=A0ABR8U2W0_9CELL|nr:SpoIIE family protein phosphatase [Oerskovia merdavium]MBD7982374.1 SpoIIE family protein phosphatase [Oerskovia merdavium]